MSRKIIHVDMDAFYASVEQRDAPALRGKPVVVAWRGSRSVVCAASYEARKFGVRSAMPAVTAERLCPDAVFVPPDFPRYREVSRQIREIFHQHTDLVEPLSLDEAYLDVSANKQDLPTATLVARQIRQEIRAVTGLTASAGVAPNKFLAKIASDWRKPDGLFVIQPHEVKDFLAPLPVGRLPGVGRATEHQLQLLGIMRVGDLRQVRRDELVRRFGRMGDRLARLALGEDDSAVAPDRPLQQISVEQTLAEDLEIAGLAPVVRECALKTWLTAQRRRRIGRTVVLKLKTAEFQTLSRSITPPLPVQSAAELVEQALALLARVDLPATTRYRLAGVGMSNFPPELPQENLL
jgi:DNA polymerase-4